MDENTKPILVEASSVEKLYNGRLLYLDIDHEVVIADVGGIPCIFFHFNEEDTIFYTPEQIFETFTAFIVDELIRLGIVSKKDYNNYKRIQASKDAAEVKARAKNSFVKLAVSNPEYKEWLLEIEANGH